MLAKFILNPDLDRVEKVHNALLKKEEKYGKTYCPCVLEPAHSEDTICPCKEYRDTGKCRCGLYVE